VNVHYEQTKFVTRKAGGRTKERTAKREGMQD